MFEKASFDLLSQGDKEDNRLVGPSVFPVDINTTITSQHHPWACSLRTRGFRGRHRCGVTLLSGDKLNDNESPGNV